MFGRIGGTEILVVAIVLLVVFGGRKLPEFAKGLGEAIKELRKSFGKETDSKKS